MSGATEPEARRDELLRVAEALAVARVRAGAQAMPELCVADAQKLINSLTPWPR